MGVKVQNHKKCTQLVKVPNVEWGYILSSVSVMVGRCDGLGTWPGLTRGEMEGLRVARGDNEGEKLGDIAADVLNPPGSCPMGDRGSAAW